MFLFAGEFGGFLRYNVSEKTFWTVSFMLSLFLAAIENHDNDDKFIKLYKIYEKRVFSIAFGLTNNQYDAEDASQAAFFALARNIEKLDQNLRLQGCKKCKP